MKALLIALTVMGSVQAHAFTTVTLTNDLELKTLPETGTLVLFADEAKGSDYCTLTLRSAKNEETTVLKKGVVLTVSEETNRCGNDWGRVCRLDLRASNQEEEAKIGVTCKDKGFFAQKLTADKVNKLLKKYISVK